MRQEISATSGDAVWSSIEEGETFSGTEDATDENGNRKRLGNIVERALFHSAVHRRSENHSKRSAAAPDRGRNSRKNELAPLRLRLAPACERPRARALSLAENFKEKKAPNNGSRFSVGRAGAAEARSRRLCLTLKRERISRLVGVATTTTAPQLRQTCELDVPLRDARNAPFLEYATPPHASSAPLSRLRDSGAPMQPPLRLAHLRATTIHSVLASLFTQRRASRKIAVSPRGR